MAASIEILPKHYCTGCAACLNCCPASAITMVQDGNGFSYPQIDSQICIKCGICSEKCPELGFAFVNRSAPKVYGMMAADDIRKKSSSGGMFSLLANYVFDKGGIVCGAAFSDPCELKFSFATTSKQLEPIKGSKYFQADIARTFSEIKKYLEKKIHVLFCACPCQVAGLLKFLGRHYDNLLTADVICHGVPSGFLIKQYLNSIEDINEIDYLDFRDKTVYKWSTTITIRDKKKNIKRISYDNSSFYKAFGNGLIMRESCYLCKFADIPRVGDFTLGDYWHISEFNNELSDGFGTSCVLLNNDKADKIYKEIEPLMKASSPMPLETATKYNEQLRKCIIRNPNRDKFYELIKNTDFDTAIKECINKTVFDVGITGYWYATNYGSVLTYYSLYKAIEQLGYSVVLLDRPDKHMDGEPQHVFSRKFMEKYANISPSYRWSERNKFNNLCDKFIIGSDQVWTKNAILHMGYMFFLDFVSDDKVKIAYAPSFGRNDFNVLPETKRIVSYLLSRFDAVSVREDTGIELCKREFNISAQQMIDPIFLNGRSFYENIADYSRRIEKEPFILSYILDPNQNKRNMLIYAQNRKKLQLLNILDGRYNTFDRNNNILNLPNTDKDIEMEDWVKMFKDCEFVITDSHHGLAMAVIFNKPFICIKNNQRGGSRFDSLLSWLGLHSRLIDENDHISDFKHLFDDIDYKRVNDIISSKRNDALKWLSDGLVVNKETPSTVYDLLAGRLCEMERSIAAVKEENKKLKELLSNNTREQ